VPLHRALEPLALGSALDVDEVAGLEELPDVNGAPGLRVFLRVAPDLG